MARRQTSAHDGNETRETLLKLAARTFGEQGYSATTMRNIAEQSGIEAASIYYHFASKEELVDEVMEQGGNRIISQQQERLAALGADATAEQRFRAAVLGQMNPGAPGQAPAGAKQLRSKEDGPFLPAGALNLPQSLRTTFEGVGPQGWKLTAHGVWFARMEPAGARLYHAVIYSDKPRTDEANNFFASLQLQ